MLSMRLHPFVSISLLIAFLALSTTAVAQDPDCHNGVWEEGEFCGYDAKIATGETDMNHDCVLDVIDLILFSSQIGMEGPNLSGDFDGNDRVDPNDAQTFAASYYSGNPVSPCNPSSSAQYYCGGNLSLSLDPNIIVSRGRAASFETVPIYVVASGLSSAVAIEYALATTSNVILSNTSSPIGWMKGTADAEGYDLWQGLDFPATGSTVVLQQDIIILDALPATIELVDIGGSSYSPLTRWISEDLSSLTEFVVRRNVGINMIDPVSTSGCLSTNTSPTLTITDPASDIQVTPATASYVIEGLADDGDGDIVLIEYRVNDEDSWHEVLPIDDPWTVEVDLVTDENWIQVRTADNEGAYSSTQVVSIERLEPTGLAITAWSGPSTLYAGCLLSDVSVTVQNVSGVNAPACDLGFYLSTDAGIDPSSDYLVDTYPVPALQAGESIVITTAITVPDDGPRGSVHLGAFVNFPDYVYESDETNNAASSPLEYPIPAIISIVDVENDQGRVVRLNLLASARDAMGSSTPILQYEAFRRIDPLLAGTGPESVPVVQGTQISGSLKLADWEFVGAVPAHGHLEYNMIVPTLADATDQGGIHWSVFFVRAATAQPLVFFDSCLESGYSVDNLAPCVPKSLLVAYSAGGNQLSWEPNSEEDFHNFRIYRGSSPDFVPDEGNLIEETAGTDWLDDSSDPWSHYYKISAVDFSGNESEREMPTQVTGTPGSEVPVRTTLLNAVPNPFNPSTKLPFQMAAAGHAVLKVYDTAGRLIATLVDEHRDAGRHDVIWNGRDDTGRMSSAGVYLYRFETENFSMTKRMVLLK